MPYRPNSKRWSLGRKLTLAGIVVTVAGVGWLLLLVDGSTPSTAAAQDAGGSLTAASSARPPPLPDIRPGARLSEVKPGVHFVRAR